MIIFLENRLAVYRSIALNQLACFYEYNTALMAIPKRDFLNTKFKPVIQKVS